MVRLLPVVEKRYRPIFVTPETDLVIEGYPRSGNTYSVAAFLTSQPTEVQVARHLHLAGHVIRGINLGRPTLILIREPEAAALSLVIRLPFLSIRQALRDYKSFYESILPYRAGFVVGAFERVTKDFGCVVRKINARFGTGFVPFEATEANVQRAMQMVEEMDRQDTGHKEVTETHVGRPSAERQALKEKLNRLLEASELDAIRRETREIYRRYLDLDATAG